MLIIDYFHESFFVNLKSKYIFKSPYHYKNIYSFYVGFVHTCTKQVFLGGIKKDCLELMDCYCFIT